MIWIVVTDVLPRVLIALFTWPRRSRMLLVLFRAWVRSHHLRTDATLILISKQ